MPDAGCRMPDAGCRMPDASPASSAWDGSRPLASPPDPNASPDGRCTASRPPRPVRRVPAFSTDGRVLFAARVRHAACRPRRGLAATLLALSLPAPPEPAAVQTTPRHCAGLMVTPGGRQVPPALTHPQPRQRHRGPGLPVPRKNIPAHGASNEIHGDRPDRRHAPRLLQHGASRSPPTPAKGSLAHLDARQAHTPRGSGPRFGE